MSNRTSANDLDAALFGKPALKRAKKELGGINVRSRWIRETVDPFDLPQRAKRGAF